MCDLDFKTYQALGEFEFLCGGGTVDIIEKRRFCINESITGIIVHELFTTKAGTQGKPIYQTGEFLIETWWVWKLKKLHKLMKKANLYQTRQKELLQQSLSGMM